MTNWKTCLQFQITCSEFHNQAVRSADGGEPPEMRPCGGAVGHVEDSRAVGALLLTRPPTPLVRHAAAGWRNLASAVLGLSPCTTLAPTVSGLFCPELLSRLLVGGAVATHGGRRFAGQ